MFKKDNALILPPGAKPKAPPSKGLRKVTEEDVIDIPVMTFQRNIKCPECEKGLMIANGKALSQFGPFQHECNMCKCLYDFVVQYPSPVYRALPQKPPSTEDDRHDGGA